jgi:hypothetical protein
LSIKQYSGDQTKDNEMGGEYSKYEEEVESINAFGWEPEGKRPIV